MKIFNIKYLMGAAIIIALNACQSVDGNKTGSEFIPDMAHSIAIEANMHHNYSLNNFDDESVIKKEVKFSAGLPVKGTIPRGYSGSIEGNSDSQIATNGSVPYHYADTEEERTRAIAEIIQNPYPITDAGLTQGKELYNIFCAICHGENANGLGYLVSEDNPNAKYPAAPANFLLDDHINSSNGRYYHAIMYGKNVMGGYADKMSYKERWEVIHYIRSLQAKEKKVTYNSMENTLNNGATPAAKMVVETPVQISEATTESPVTDSHEDASH